MQNGAQIGSKIDLFLDPLWRCLATSILGRFWGRFGVPFGTILESKIGLKAIGKNIKKMVGKKSRPSPPGRAGRLACGPLKETSQTGDWQLATGNWQDWGPADLFRFRNTPLRALRGARWRTK